MIVETYRNFASKKDRKTKKVFPARCLLNRRVMTARLAILVALFSVFTFASVNAEPLVQPKAKFFPLPARKKHHDTLQARSQFYSLNKVAAQKPRGKTKSPQLAKEIPPSGDAHKLLLYVYNELE